VAAGYEARRAAAPARVTPAAVALLLVVAVLAGCTGGDEQEPTPAPEPIPVEEPPPAPVGRDLTVVLPPDGLLDDRVHDALRRRTAALAAGLPPDVGELTVRSPDAAPFVVDLAELAASRGTGLVCLLGPDTAAATDTLASRYGGVRFCGLPTALPEADEEGQVPDTPGVRVELPVEALGQLVGQAAGTVAREGGDDPVVGLLLGGDELPTSTFRDGLLRGLAGVEVVEAEDADATPAAAIEALLAAEARVVVLDGHLGAREAIAALDGRAPLVAPVDLIDDVPPEQAALGYRLRHEVALAAVFDSFASGTLEEVSLLLGVEDGVVDLRVGPGRADLEVRLARALEALATRDDPRAPVPEGPGTGPQGGL